MADNSVDLPAPLGPISMTHSPAATERLTSRTAKPSPKATLSPIVSSMPFAS